MTPAGPEDCEIDEDGAWALVRAAGDASFEPGSPALKISTGNVTAAISAGGAWKTAQSVSSSASSMLDIYLPYAASGRTPTVMAQIGQSLDGQIATAAGHSHYITGEAGLDHLHRLRALSDAVVVGAGTAVADDPRLTVRRTGGPNPVRVVIDVSGRVPTDGKMFRDGAAPTLILTSRESAPSRSLPDGVDVLAMETCDGTLPPPAIVKALSARGLNRILVEGGGVTISRFLEAGVLDRLHVSVAPLIIGSGRPAFALPMIDRLDDALRPACRHHALGDDMLFDLDLR